MSKQVASVREILWLNGLSINDTAARKAFQEEINQTKDLIKAPRYSDPSKQLLDRIDQIRLQYADRNETTFTNKFFGVFQSQSRHVKQNARSCHGQGNEDEEGDLQENRDQENLHVPVGWATRDWEDDGLDENNNRVFQAGSVPRIHSLDENHQAILKDLPRISNPQPDILHGTCINKHYTGEERAIIAQFKGITQISLDLACPFFGVEVKTKGDIEEAVNQACTGGAAMVWAHRRLVALAQSAIRKAKTKDTAKTNQTVTETNTPIVAASKASKPSGNTNVAGAKANAQSKTSKADFSTKAFTLVLSPRLALINVHWAEVCEQSVRYHMHSIRSCALDEEDDLKACRAAANNILDWGLGERDKQIKALLNQVYDAYKVLKAAKATEKGKGKSVDKSPESKKRRMNEVDNSDGETWEALSNPEDD
ncbi:MAG: hypothetical protein LQ345_000611 [Seirophora villosa]|nr:MAG: hypothetical protein LQ345_000611 [Seirophora villosa]